MFWPFYLKSFYTSNICCIRYKARVQSSARGRHIESGKDIGKDSLRRPTEIASVVLYPDVSHSVK